MEEAVFCIAILQVQTERTDELWETSLLVITAGTIIPLEERLGFIEVHSVYEDPATAESRARALLDDWLRATAAGQADLPGIPAPKQNALFVTAYTRWNSDNKLEYRGQITDGRIPAEIPAGWDLVIIDIMRDAQKVQEYRDLKAFGTVIATIYAEHFEEA